MFAEIKIALKAYLLFKSHSYRSASNGSTLTARRVGAQQASSATPENNNPTPIKVTGSVGSTSNRNDLNTRDKTSRRDNA